MPKITASWPVRPSGAYGVVKVFGEAMARSYVDEHGLSVLCLRFGTVQREGEEGAPTSPRTYATAQSARDLVHQVECCIEAPDSVRFGIFPGVSKNTWRFWDISEAQLVIGYEPQDDMERWRPKSTP